jgi:hypothetical protein
MNRTLLAVVVLAGLALAQSDKDAKHEHGAGHDEATCPMHAEHMKGQQHDGMQARGADEHGMGFSQEATTHHFRLTREGGVIEVTAKDAKDRKTISQVEMHLEHIEKSFAAGDFAIPHFVHDQEPPGVDVMRARKSELGYRFERVKNGGQLVITAKTPETLKALHEFLKFQIKEHETGDALEVAAK